MRSFCIAMLSIVLLVGDRRQKKKQEEKKDKIGKDQEQQRKEACEARSDRKRGSGRSPSRRTKSGLESGTAEGVGGVLKRRLRVIEGLEYYGSGSFGTSTTAVRPLPLWSSLDPHPSLRVDSTTVVEVPKPTRSDGGGTKRDEVGGGRPAKVRTQRKNDRNNQTNTQEARFRPGPPAWTPPKFCSSSSFH